MTKELVFPILIIGLIITLIVLLLVQFVQSKKNKKQNDASDETSDTQSRDEDDGSPAGIGVPDVLFTAMPAGMAYKKALRSFHMSLHKIVTKYDVTEESLAELSEKDINKLFSICKKNILAFKKIRELEKKNELTCVENVPSYKYLSYIYVHRDDYQLAMYACATALKLNACNPEGKKEMIDRINTLSEKSDLEIPDNIQELMI